MNLELSEPPKIYTIDEFMALSSNDKRYELVDGFLIENSLIGDEHGSILTSIALNLQKFVEQNDLGKVWACTCFIIKNTTVRLPDVAFIGRERLLPQSKGPVAVIPDLAVEVISPGDDWSKIVEKVREYQAAGVKLIWLIDPNLQGVFIFQPNDKLPTITDTDLDGDTVVPGYKLNIAKLFE
jgi:Uma2 family endonuclease